MAAIIKVEELIDIVLNHSGEVMLSQEETESLIQEIEYVATKIAHTIAQKYMLRYAAPTIVLGDDLGMTVAFSKYNDTLGKSTSLPKIFKRYDKDCE